MYTILYIRCGSVSRLTLIVLRRKISIKPHTAKFVCLCHNVLCESFDVYYRIEQLLHFMRLIKSSLSRWIFKGLQNMHKICFKLRNPECNKLLGFANKKLQNNIQNNSHIKNFPKGVAPFLLNLHLLIQKIHYVYYVTHTRYFRHQSFRTNGSVISARQDSAGL